MKITLNGKEEIVRDGTTLGELISFKQLNSNGIIVVYNYQPVKKESWQDTVLKENDSIELLKFVGGG